MSLQTSWEQKNGRLTHYIRLDYQQVVVGSHAGSGHTDNASACGYGEFLNGRFHPDILAHFDQTTLTAVIIAVQAAKTHPPFVAKRNKINSVSAWLESIPITPALADIPTHPDTENGFRNYGNAGGYKTVVHSDTVTLTVERDKGFLTANEGGKAAAFTLPAHASSVVALHNYFYIIVSDDYAIIAPNGVVSEKETAVFGTFLRINRVWRLADTICFGYFWFQGNAPRGLLRYELGVGFNGRYLHKPAANSTHK